MLSTEEKLELDGLCVELERLSRWKKERMGRGLELYVPNAIQERAHKSLARYVLFCGGNRSGKSTYGAMELVWHLTRRYPSWYPYEKRFRGPIKAVVSSTTFKIVETVIEPKIRQYLPQDYYEVKRGHGGYACRVNCKDGSAVDILTSEMDDMAYESADWDFAWCDEPQQRRKWNAIQRGLTDRGGRAVITFTPLTQPWMKEELVDKADGKQIDVFKASIRDNKFDIEGRPILSEENIKELLKGISEDERETRELGTFFHIQGAIYKEFSDVHITDFEYGKQKNPVICVLDPHDRRPHHLIWAFIDKTDDVFIDFELEINCELDELAKHILRIEKERSYEMKARLIDPNFGRKPAKVGANFSVIRELARNGASFYEANDKIELGHMIVRDYLHYDHSKPITAVNKPKLFFSKDRVSKTIRSMRNYQYEDWRGVMKGEKDPKENAKDKDSHGADCIRYLLISKPQYRSNFERVENELVQAPY